MLGSIVMKISFTSRFQDSSRGSSAVEAQMIVGVESVPPGVILVVVSVTWALPVLPGEENVSVEMFAPTEPPVSRNCNDAW
jgi:hypothetical protein